MSFAPKRVTTLLAFSTQILSPDLAIPQADQNLAANGLGNEFSFLDTGFNVMVDGADLDNILLNLN